MKNRKIFTGKTGDLIRQTNAVRSLFCLYVGGKCMSINLSTAEAITRDKRLKTVTFYHDSASNIRSRTKDGSIKDGTNYFSQCSDCSQMCAEGLTCRRFIPNGL